MEWNDWLLAFHLLSAFALVAATTLFWVFIFTVRRTDLPEQVASVARLVPVGTVVVAVGSLGTIVFGIWLAIALDGIQVWDGWVIAAIVLWLVASGAGQRAGAVYARAEHRAGELLEAGSEGASPELRALARSRQGLVLHTIATIAALLILADMIWKPWA
jgi:uncharacterized membrane protein